MTEDSKYDPPTDSFIFIKDDSPNNILETRLAQIDSSLSVLLGDPEGQLHGLQPIIIHEALWGIQELVHQARKALREMSQQSKPAATVILSDGDEPIDLQEASLDVIREVIVELEDTLICPRLFLKAVDQQDKVVANEAPGDEA